MNEKNNSKIQKAKLQAWISPETLIRLRNFLIEAYGSTYYLGFVVDEALKQYLDSVDGRSTHTHENQHMKIDNDSSPTKKHIELLKWLGKNYNHQVMLSEIEKFIETEIGIDSRTKRKYRDFLLKNGFIKIFKQLSKSEAICEVNARKIYEFLKQHVSHEELNNYAIAEALNLNVQDDKIKLWSSIKAYAAERYRSGDDLDEISEKLEQVVNVTLSKKQVKSLIKSVLRDEFV